MQAFLAELIGTAMLVLLGDGVCCNISLNKSGMKGGNTVHILIGWGMAVMVPAFSFGAMSGAHFNPAVTIGAAIRGCFCTGPSIRNPFLNFCSEFVATFVLVFTLASIPANSVTVGDNVYAIASNANWVLVYGVIVACGASFGGLTGYAMNAARDSAPRLAYQLLAPNKGHKDADWGYGWIPAVAPICGGAVASFVYMALQSMGG